MSATRHPRVSVIIPARDEIRRWPVVLANLRAQTLQPDEIIVADGMSTDGSRTWLAAAAAADPRLVVVDNPARIVPAALNAALARAGGDVVARMDTHADYAPDYLRTVVAFLAEHPEVPGVGGSMATVGEGPWGRAIAAVLRRRLGLGGARHRVGGAPGPIAHVFSGCYRRDALLAAGGWDERLRANEDFEADLRVAGSAGSPLWLEPAARTTWYTRRDLPALARQMWRYGFYKSLTLYLHPGSLKPRQLAPPALVLALVVLPLLHPLAAGTLAAVYLAATAAAGARAAAVDGVSPLRGAAVPAVVHLSWGAGVVAGLVRFAPWQSRHVRLRPTPVEETSRVP